jgi:hypothetical protein
LPGFVLVGDFVLSLVDMLMFAAPEVTIVSPRCTKVYLAELLGMGVTVVVNVTCIVCFPPELVTNTGGEKVFFW